jgi:predicted ATPase/DNA-binding SARP family transcriptional activator
VVRFDVLGPLVVTADDGRVVTPRGAQQRRALTALVASAPNAVSVDALEALLWPNGAPSTNALQALCSKLRKVVAPTEIGSDAHGYALLTSNTDRIEFERLISAGEHAAAEALVRGVPLDEIADDEIGLASSVRLQGLATLARRRRLDEVVRGPQPLDAVGEVQALLIDDPLDESLWAQLMLAQYRSGQQADALRTYRRARKAITEGLGLEPGPELTDLERQILEHDPTLDPSSPRIISSRVTRPVLPGRLASFIGRQEELDALTTAMKSHRLVTLLGPGGMGKTSTALELVRRAASDRARFVEFAGLIDCDAMVRAIARAVGLPDIEPTTPRGATSGIVGGVGQDGGAGERVDPLDRIIDALATTMDVLVFDNCEHVIATAADVTRRLLVACPDITIVATSREALGVPGEFACPLDPLPTDDAVQLFVERAGEHGTSLRSDDRSRDNSVGGDDESALVALAERLDGLPLAIELAAARSRSMSVGELTERLDDRFELLSHGARTVDARQQTLRAVVDWSHDLLDPAERVVFRRLAAFVDGATRDAVVATCSSPGPDVETGQEREMDRSEVLDVVDRLVDKSLVNVERTPLGVRFSMLQTIHAYASERLTESGEREHVLVRHARHVAEWLRPAQRGLTGRDQATWFTRIGQDRQNIEAAIGTATARADAQLALELTAPIGWYFYMAGELEAGALLLGDALAIVGPTDPGLRATVLGLYGWLTANGPDLEVAVAATTRAFEMIDRVDDEWARVVIVGCHAMANFFGGRIDVVDAALPVLVDIADRSEDPWVLGIVGVVRGEAEQLRGHVGAAERLFADAAERFEQVGDRFAYSLAITETAELGEMFGDYDHVVEVLERSLSTADEIGFSGHPMAMRARLASVEILRGNLEIAERQLEDIIIDDGAQGVPWLQTLASVGLAHIAQRRGDLEAADAHAMRAWVGPRTQAVPFMRSVVLVTRGRIADQRGDFGAALALQRDGLQVALQLRAPRTIAYSLEGCAGALSASPATEHHELGAELLGRAHRLRTGSGAALPPGERYDVDRAEQRIRSTLGDAAVDDLVAAGADRSTEELVDAVMSLAD